MEFNELLSNYERKNITSQELVQWCIENVDKIEIDNPEQTQLNMRVIAYLMKDKIGNWTKEEAIFAINFLAKFDAYTVKLKEDLKIQILDEEELKKEYGENTDAICVTNNKSFVVKYSPKVVEQLCSSNISEFLRGLQTVFHEIVHVQQDMVIQSEELRGNDLTKSAQVYIMTLETLARKEHPELYTENYDYLMKENQAEKLGLQRAIETIKTYNPKAYELYDREKIDKKIEEYSKVFYSSEMLFSDKKFNPMKVIDFLASSYIEKNPDVLKKYPSLKYGFNVDGSKKDIIDILKDRNEMIKNGDNKEKIDDFYRAIAFDRNCRVGGLKGSKEEIVELVDYISETGTADDFIFDLIEHKMQTSFQMEEAEVEKRMKIVHNVSDKARNKNDDGR